MHLQVEQAEGQQRRVKFDPRRQAAGVGVVVPGTRAEPLGQTTPILAHLVPRLSEGGLGIAQGAHVDPLQQGEDEHTVGHLVAGPGQVYWDILTESVVGEGGDEVGQEADLEGRESPPCLHRGGEGEGRGGEDNLCYFR